MTTRDEAVRHQVCMTPIGCDDCGEPFRSFMVTDAVWSETGLPAYGAVVCLPCLGGRVGRDLGPSDFLACEANAWFTV